MAWNRNLANKPFHYIRSAQWFLTCNTDLPSSFIKPSSLKSIFSLEDKFRKMLQRYLVVDLLARSFLVTCFVEKRQMIGYFSWKCSTEEGSRDCAPLFAIFPKQIAEYWIVRLIVNTASNIKRAVIHPFFSVYQSDQSQQATRQTEISVTVLIS